MHLRMSSKMDLRLQKYAKCGKCAKLKNESKTNIFSAPGDTQESANGTTINVFDAILMVQFRVHLIIHLIIQRYTKRCTQYFTKRCISGSTWVGLAYAIGNALECTV